MSYDPDEFDQKADEIADAGKLLSKLQSCDLESEWDIDFVNDLTDRIAKYGSRTHISSSQWEQLERLRKQYGIE